MAVFTVHAPRHPDGAPADPAELVFVKDGFCWPALFIPLVWLIWRGLWLALLIYIVLAVGLGLLSGVAGSAASSAVMLLFAVWFALEANGLRRWTLERHGHVLLGVVEGQSRSEAERRYFEADAVALPAAAPAAPPEPPPTTLPVAPPSVRKPPPGIVGLFPAPGTAR